MKQLNFFDYYSPRLSYRAIIEGTLVSQLPTLIATLDIGIPYITNTEPILLTLPFDGN